VNNLATASGGMTEAERLAHYRQLAAQFREWAEAETNQEARAVCSTWPGNTIDWRAI